MPGLVLAQEQAELGHDSRLSTAESIANNIIIVLAVFFITMMSSDRWASVRRRQRRDQRERERGQLRLGEEPRTLVEDRPQGFTFDNASPADPETSIEAARPTKRKSAARSLHQAEILEELRAAEERGCTDDELKIALHWRPEGGTSKRRKDLVDAGIAVDSGMRRESRYGATQIVWVIA